MKAASVTQDVHLLDGNMVKMRGCGALGGISIKVRVTSTPFPNISTWVCMEACPSGRPFLGFLAKEDLKGCVRPLCFKPSQWDPLTGSLFL